DQSPIAPQESISTNLKPSTFVLKRWIKLSSVAEPMVTTYPDTASLLWPVIGILSELLLKRSSRAENANAVQRETKAENLSTSVSFPEDHMADFHHLMMIDVERVVLAMIRRVPACSYTLRLSLSAASTIPSKIFLKYIDIKCKDGNAFCSNHRFEKEGWVENSSVITKMLPRGLIKKKGHGAINVQSWDILQENVRGTKVDQRQGNDDDVFMLLLLLDGVRLVLVILLMVYLCCWLLVSDGVSVAVGVGAVVVFVILVMN
ncbi:hypothetical protein Tco_0702487, partial [Tanacetum coccineum]